jgi:hypothetical protein
MKGAWRWQGLPLLLKRHPRVRHEFPFGLFWKRTHVWAPFAALGWLGMKRSRFAIVLAAPWVVHATPKHGVEPRPRMRALMELPAKFAIDASEILALAWGSVKHRTPFL